MPCLEGWLRLPLQIVRRDRYRFTPLLLIYFNEILLVQVKNDIPSIVLALHSLFLCLMLEEHKIRDPIHGFIHFSDKERAIIDSSHFQRLRGIKQLALTCLVYPGAMHTRFEHTLGVMEMATRAYDSLSSRHPVELKKNFNRVDLNLQEARQLLRLTALFHDTGHLPFSH